MIINIFKSPLIAWIFAILAIILTVLYSQGVIGKYQAKKDKLEFPKQWSHDVKLALVFTNDRGLFVLDNNGEAVKSCNTCTNPREKKWGAGCKKAPKSANICGPLKSVIPREQIIITSGYGSDCWFVYPSLGELIGYPTNCIIH
ncbi:hypothetical protein MNBD_GAMMA21-892 [hydrothermal vent metagenome]|uniref:Uncharacterized protein n=1 Tax=hydrothermal vent metagenome TaxID=652676 RepID=A0A3B0ZDB3_9ZZZZ